MSATLQSLPRDDGFRMPAEWEPHAGTWMIWPERPDNWRLGGKPAQQAFAAVATAIAEAEPVTMLVSAGQWENARQRLPAHVRLVEATTNDAWCRDTGPSFVVSADGRLRGNDWRFNAWGGFNGGLYSPWDQDDRAAAKILEIEGAPRYRAPFVLEGGAIHVDGEGTLLTTQECLLNPNRNPYLDRSEIEEHLAARLGVSKTIWLGPGLFHDETDGHIDNLACFVRPGVVALTWCEDPDDPQYAISHDAHERLAAATDAQGRRLQIVKLPMPGPLHMTDAEAAGIDVSEGSAERRGGARLAASYANYYIANGLVVMPLLDPKTDQAAMEIIAALHPDRRIVGIEAREILLGGGNIHCITQQQPVGRPG
ncbi:agmatine deiminase [Kaistia sp. MMO-174]|uniref:agmatine deiminase n=1 Tax=Kaistia sp. MMO-174 TaxID=3081256 RepID=UPI0030174554